MSPELTCNYDLRFQTAFLGGFSTRQVFTAKLHRGAKLKTMALELRLNNMATPTQGEVLAESVLCYPQTLVTQKQLTFFFPQSGKVLCMCRRFIK